MYHCISFFKRKLSVQSRVTVTKKKKSREIGKPSERSRMFLLQNVDQFFYHTMVKGAEGAEKLAKLMKHHPLSKRFRKSCPYHTVVKEGFFVCFLKFTERHSKYKYAISMLCCFVTTSFTQESYLQWSTIYLRHIFHCLPTPSYSIFTV